MNQDDIPQPTIVRSKRRKRTVSLNVQQDGSLRVLAPQRTSMKWINEFIKERADWIDERRRAIAKRQENPTFVFEDGASLPFQGEPITLRIIEGEADSTITTNYNENTKEISVSLPCNMNETLRKDEIKTELTLWYKKQARLILPKRTAYWSEIMGLKPTRLALSNTKTQWGSCNSKNEIRLNWRLILASPDLYDYVIVHELSHIPHKNHGDRFWTLCVDTLPDTVKRRQALKKWEEKHHPTSFP